MLNGSGSDAVLRCHGIVCKAILSDEWEQDNWP